MQIVDDLWDVTRFKKNRGPERLNDRREPDADPAVGRRDGEFIRRSRAALRISAHRKLNSALLRDAVRG
jgi:hypothetical protein